MTNLKVSNSDSAYPCVMKFVKIPTSFRDISDYIYSHLLPRDCVISDFKGINYYTFILVRCVSL